jgi:YVTN family beta-propeller protein
VSVIDPANPSTPVGSIPVGLHPTALYSSGNALFVTNTNDDTVSVIDTTTNQVVQTIETKPWPSSSVGYEPDGIVLTRDGHLLVTLGRANAVAVYRYDGTPKDPVSYIGLLPTDYYPATVATVGDQIVVTNTRGIDARSGHHDLQGTGNRPRQRPRHAQHNGIPDALHASERQGHRARYGDGVRAERLDKARRPAGGGAQGQGRAGPSAHR